MPGCWWHPNRATGLRCTRCDRPACPDCLREASVGYQCIDCVQAGRQADRAQRRQYRGAGYGTRTVAGAVPAERAVVTPVLIAINLALFVLTVIQAQSLMQNELAPIEQDSMMWTPGVVFNGEWWRLLTSGFFHIGPLHVAVNMFSLWVLGRDIELLLGRVRFLAVYVLSLFGGSVAVMLFDQIDRPSAGASGAIYGLLGGLLVAVLRLRLNPVPALVVIAVNIAISIGIPNISLLAHLGGLVVGALVTAAMVYAPEKNRAFWQAGAVALLAVALIGLVVYRDSEISGMTCGYLRQVFVCR